MPNIVVYTEIYDQQWYFWEKFKNWFSSKISKNPSESHENAGFPQIFLKSEEFEKILKADFFLIFSSIGIPNFSENK